MAERDFLDFARDFLGIKPAPAESDATTVDCNGCGIRFSIPTTYANARQRDGKTLCCPNGHHVRLKDKA